MIMHPEIIRDSLGNVKQLWLEPEVQHIVDLLHNGDPLKGWEGDPRLALYLESDGTGGRGSRWVLERYCEDGTYQVVCRSRPGVGLDTLIPHLVAHDTWKQKNHMMKFLDKIEKEQESREKELAERMVEPLERVYHAIGKDLGNNY